MTSRNLIICADGTWNNPNQTDRNKSTATNVLKIAKGLELDDSQILFYDKGVGAGWKGRKMVEGFSGAGLSKNIMEAYKFLAINYQPGDKLYFMGFSRGAFTVRSLGGVIISCGLLKPELAKDYKYLSKVFRAYQLQWASSKMKDEYQKFKDNFTVSVTDADITIGVWDTVASLGVPLLGKTTFPWNKFHLIDLYKGHKVKVFHAVATDELRKQFPVEALKNHADLQDYEERWFIGSHSNIGGGYFDSGLSDITLKWMAEKMEAVGVKFKPEFISELKPDPYAEFRNSRLGWYKLFVNLRDYDPKHQIKDPSIEQRHQFWAMGYHPRRFYPTPDPSIYEVPQLDRYTKIFVTLSLIFLLAFLYSFSKWTVFTDFFSWLKPHADAAYDYIDAARLDNFPLWYLPLVLFAIFYFIGPVLWFPLKQLLVRLSIGQLKKMNAKGNA